MSVIIFSDFICSSLRLSQLFFRVAQVLSKLIILYCMHIMQWPKHCCIFLILFYCFLSVSPSNMFMRKPIAISSLVVPAAFFFFFCREHNELTLLRFIHLQLILHGFIIKQLLFSRTWNMPLPCSQWVVVFKFILPLDSGSPYRTACLQHEIKKCDVMTAAKLGFFKLQTAFLSQIHCWSCYKQSPLIRSSVSQMWNL